MTAKEFESLTSGIAANTIKLDRGEMSIKDYVKLMKIILGKEVFEKAIEILDED
ncbi:MAG: hypothetical protein FWG44_03540 [Oscillospiraceae bacterium]|nr:hypothetical protein [Oscillospiraceae bacterium]